MFGSLPDGLPPHGPGVLAETGTRVPALDTAMVGICVGERRLVRVPPRLGWSGSAAHHDTITVELVLVRLNDIEAPRLGKEDGIDEDEMEVVEDRDEL